MVLGMSGLSLTKKQQAGAALSVADQRRLRHDIRDHADIMAPQMAGWIRDAVRVSRQVAFGNTDLIPVFWIRLYGVLADIGDKVGGQIEMVIAAGVPLRELGPLNQALMALVAVFTKDELIFLQYLRHVQCHPLQDAYRLKLTAKGLKDEVKHRLLGDTKTLEETNAAIRRVHRRFGIDEDAIAADFAKRSYERLAQFQAASFAWCGHG
jgi:hypothetical protein